MLTEQNIKLSLLNDTYDGVMKEITKYVESNRDFTKEEGMEGFYRQGKCHGAMEVQSALFAVWHKLADEIVGKV